MKKYPSWFDRVTHWYVYRLWDRDDRLLYVGLSSEIHVRFRMHNYERRWFKKDVRSFSFEVFHDRRTAMAVERLRIKTEYPMHNKQSVNRQSVEAA